MISDEALAPGAHAPRLRADVDDVDVARVDDVTAARRAASRRPARRGSSRRGRRACCGCGPTGTRASAQSRRMPISQRDISSENIATGSPVTAMLRAMFVASDDLPDARTGRDHDQVAGLQPRREVVEVAEAGGQPGVGGVAVLDRLEVEHRLVDQVAEDRHLVAVLAPGDVVDPLLGVVGHGLGVVGRRVRHLHDVGGRADQATPERRLRDDQRVVRGRGRGRDLVDQVAEVERTADLVEDALALERLDGGDDVDRLAAWRRARASCRRCGRWPSGRSRRAGGSRRRRRWPRTRASSRRGPIPRLRGSGGNAGVAAGGAPTSSIARANLTPSPLVAPNPARRTLRAAVRGTAVDNSGGLHHRRSRREIPCHSGPDQRFHHVENHVDKCAQRY